MYLNKNGVHFLAVLTALSGVATGVAVIGAFGLSSSISAHADSCSVPVCDLDQEVARFRAMPQGGRYAALTGYRSSYKNSTDQATLHNLAELAKRLNALFLEVKEEAFMNREAEGLLADCLLGLARYSELNAAKIAGYYRDIKGESNRFSLIGFWKERIKTYEDKTSLLELVELFSQMGIISKADGDPDYLAREARSGEESITSRLLQLYPYFEGTYSVTTRCTGLTAGDPRPNYCKGQIDRLIVLDTLNADGVQISLSIGRSALRLFRYKNVVISGGGTTFEGTSQSSGSISRLHLVLDRAAGKVSGWVKSADSLGTLEVEGSLDVTPAKIYDFGLAHPNAAPVEFSQLNGAFRGQFAGHASVLTIRTFDDGQMGASLIFSDAPSFPYAFQYSRFYPKLGIITLVGAQGNGAYLKVTAFFGRQADGSLKVHGLSYSDGTGAGQEFDLVGSTSAR